MGTEPAAQDDAGLTPPQGKPPAHEAGPDAGTDGGTDASASDGGPDVIVPSCRVHCPMGQCVDEASACPNPSAAHCMVVCNAQGADTHCVLAAKDADGDGHADSACADVAAKGDDCDDANEHTFPGAAELCDGLDNDCDGLVDLEDGLVASGTSESLGAGAGVTLAFDGSQTYGVAYRTADGTKFRALDLQGKPLGEAVPINDYDGLPSIAWGGDAFGVASSLHGGAALQRISAAGELVGPSIDLSSPSCTSFGNTAVARVGLGSWLYFYECADSDRSVSARRISSEGKVDEPVFSIADAPSTIASLAVSGTQLAAVWPRRQGADPASFFIEWTRRDATLLKLDTGDQALASDAQPGYAGSPVIAATPSGYAVAWNERAVDGSEHVWFGEFDREGQMQCGLKDLSLSFPSGREAVTLAQMVSRPGGVAIVGSAWINDFTYGLDVIEMRTGCEYVQRFRVDTKNGFFAPALASSGEHGVLLGWTDSKQLAELKKRVLGAHFCD
jgi:hypothetical protein